MNGNDITAEGGPIAVGLFALLLAFVTIVVGAWIAVVAYRGYRRSGERAVLFLAVGIAFVSTVHTSVRVVFSTAGMSSVFTDATAVASQFAGLMLVLYAIYGRPERHYRHAVAAGVISAVLTFSVPLVLVETLEMDQFLVQTGSNAVPAVVGGFVALQAYRGYRRYDNRPMLLLAVGIGLLTVGSFVPIIVFHLLLTVSDAMALATIEGIELLGLLVILQSLRRE